MERPTPIVVHHKSKKEKFGSVKQCDGRICEFCFLLFLPLANKIAHPVVQLVLSRLNEKSSSWIEGLPNFFWTRGWRKLWRRKLQKSIKTTTSQSSVAGTSSARQLLFTTLTLITTRQPLPTSTIIRGYASRPTMRTLPNSGPPNCGPVGPSNSNNIRQGYGNNERYDRQSNRFIFLERDVCSPTTTAAATVEIAVNRERNQWGYSRWVS